ncbi:MAG TPA: hypothetical protein VNC50_13155, partial [Planctomycetia bacterium]|nr:hypothetical protein [Planctomycetia bacterium]
MKRWLARSFWIAAWGAWCWAGYGLWRELPRRAGAEVSRLPIAADESVEGTTADGRIAATLRKLETETRLRLWDLPALSCASEHVFSPEARFDDTRFGFLIVANGHA